MKPLATSRQTRFERWVGVIVVLVLGFRALIPSGYMLAAVDGHTRLVICPSGLYYPAGMQSMAGMEHTSGMDQGPHSARGVEQCPFALAGGAAFFASASKAAEPRFVILQPESERAPASIPPAAPSRYHAARGPPVLA